MIQLPFIHDKIDKGSILLEQYEVKETVANGYVCHRNGYDADYLLKPVAANLDTQDTQDVQQKAAKISENLIHQNIAHLLLATKDEKTDALFTIVQTVQGEKLHHWADNKRENGALPIAKVLPILRQIANALDYAARKGFAHPALKSDCIVVTPQAEAMIYDFDLSALPANRLQKYLTASPELDWPVGYMPPEVCQGQPVNSAANQYTLAAIAYELLAGHLPFVNSNITVLRQAIIDDKPAPLPSLSDAQNMVLLKALAKNQEERYASCEAFINALEAAIGRPAPASAQEAAKTFFSNRMNIVLFVILAAFALYVFKISFDQIKSSPIKNQIITQEAQKNAEETKQLEEERKIVEAKKAAEEAKRVEEERKAAEAKKAAEEAKRIEEERKAAEAKKAAEEAKRIEEERKAAEAKKAAEEAKRIEEERKAAEAKKAAEEAKRIEEERKAAEAKKAAEEAKRIEEERKAAEAKRLEEERKAAEAKKAAEEAKRIEEERKAAEAKRLEEERKAAEAKRLEEERKAAEAKKAAEEAKRIEEEQKAAEAKKAAEEARLKDLRRPHFYAPKYLFGKDIQQFPEIVDMARVDVLDKLDQAISQAASQNQWHRVKELAIQMKAYDQTKAGNWQNTAEKQLAPSVHVSAWLYGQEVSATIMNKDKNKTPVHLTGLVSGASYSGDLVYERKGERFEGKITFKVDWKGEKEYRVILKSTLPSRELPLEDADAIQLVEVEPGEFMMGEDNASTDELRHLVKLTQKFWIGRHEITQKQWKAVMGNNPSNFKNNDNPVEGITWNEAMKFCEKLNEKVASVIPEGYKVSLPTEAQWEFAARGGKHTKYYPYSGSDIIDDVAWHSENSNVRTQPVGMKFPNELGLFDMTGNVWEWCLDACEWENKVMTDTYRDGVVDPVNTKGELHIIRGGGWLSSPKNCRLSNRLCCDTNFKTYNLGLRIVLVPKK